jgi:hypothetical protein
MIVLSLACDSGHHFDGWFASTEAFDSQAARGQVNCPHCQSASIARLPSGPRVIRGGESRPVVSADEIDRIAAWLRQAAARSEDVGEQFVREVRRIHAEEAPPRDIKGVASLAETLELLEDGIPVLPVPVEPKKH